MRAARAMASIWSDCPVSATSPASVPPERPARGTPDTLASPAVRAPYTAATRLAALLALLALAAAPAAGCKRQGARGTAPEDAGAPVTRAPLVEPGRQRIVITNIAVRTGDPRADRAVEPFEPRELGQALGRALVSTGMFAALPEHVPEGLQARPAALDVAIHYDVAETGQPDERVVLVGVECGFAWEDEGADPAPWDQLLLERPVRESAEVGDHEALVAALARDAVDRLAARLAERERVRAGGEAALAEVLADADAEPSEVRWVLDLVAHGRVQSLFDQVVEKLDADAVEVRRRAVTALATLGGAAAVGVITRRVRFDDTESLGVVIDTVALLGGEDARTYLEFVASGHPEDTMRERARAALARMGVRFGAPAPEPPRAPRP
jgi:hypothetical protein